jgi:hypothetical protein
LQKSAKTALISLISARDEQSIIRKAKVCQNEKEMAKKRFCKPIADYTTTNPQRKIKKRKIFSEIGASKIWG